ncbi:GGDEF domain-containing protein [Paramagnetospirillum magneticum]|uniref:EAL domain n=1 Tax=Paramagnetospirillum magneticum (strain ATCC 700264 / AMB-1) TaxID=342108 RepID=Q2W8B5_PARM1|nr:GGDEF domain-containing protein [Paramagnetospirillum magneticum]BAE49910.1 EAL domain [Paramagnetospirillum magneticum AMB-1]
MSHDIELNPRFPGLHVAFQAIVNVHTGQCFGHEALLRGWEGSPQESATWLLDRCHAAGHLLDLEIAVRATIGEMAPRYPTLTQGALFLNLDARAAGHLDRLLGDVQGALQTAFAHVVTEIAGLPAESDDSAYPAKLMRRGGGMVAVDRFGAMPHSLALLTGCNPDFIKIDRTLIAGLDSDARKRVVLAQIIGMAHTLGVEVIAVGIENGRELMVCRELGLDLVQGNFISPPQLDPLRLAASYPHVEVLARDDRRQRQIDQKWVLQQMDQVPAILADAPMSEIFERFARSSDNGYAPVVDHSGRPLGIVRERDTKNYAYSSFGKDLIANKSLGRQVRDFIVRCPIADIGTPLDQMLALYAAVEETDGILLSDHMVYRGFLSARSLIRAMHEKTLARARDENPLSKLPGNVVINEYVADCVTGGAGAVLAYIDFDNFKPFNDTYGFRQGDRAILLFAELCRKRADPQSWFVGHIGGDDFFVGITHTNGAEAALAIGELIGRFASDAESFYDQDARQRRCITAQDREGHVKSFPLLSASAVLFVLPPGCTDITVDDVASAIAARKKEAKETPSKLVVIEPAPAG